MNNKVTFMQPYYSQVVEKKIIFNLVVVCEEKKIVRGKRDKNIFYYFIMQFILFYWVVCKNKNLNVG